jgi:uncharacterized protein (DUF302 family)
MQRFVSIWILVFLTTAAQAAELSPPKPNPYLSPANAEQQSPWFVPKPTQGGSIFVQQALPRPQKDYEMSRVIPSEEKRRMMKLAMPMMSNMMRLDAREAINYSALKVKAKPGLSFDDVVESMMLRANQLNFKHVGTNPMWKDFRAVLGDENAPRIEVFSFCDIAVGRQLLKQIPEMIIYLPCRIAVMEDGDKNIWLLTIDWDVTWLDEAGSAMNLTPELRQMAMDVKNKMDSIMRAGANGEL